MSRENAATPASVKTGEWPSYPGNIQQIELPGWKVRPEEWIEMEESDE